MEKRKKRIEIVRKRLLLNEIEELSKVVFELKRDFHNRKYDLFGSPPENIHKFKKDTYANRFPQKISLEHRIENLEINKKL